MEDRKRIALVGHDNRKADLLDWVTENHETLVKHRLVCTGTTGKMIEEALNKLTDTPVDITKLKSGPLGGDQQLGAMITDGEIDIMIFFWDPMQPQPHDVDVKALLRITVLYNVPTACNRSTADFFVNSSLFNNRYTPKIKDYSYYINRALE